MPLTTPVSMVTVGLPTLTMNGGAENNRKISSQFLELKVGTHGVSRPALSETWRGQDLLAPPVASGNPVASSCS